ncbi:MAG: hypothetical protein R2707_15000 [Acidimicrobiales bacterium]
MSPRVPPQVTTDTGIIAASGAHGARIAARLASMIGAATGALADSGSTVADLLAELGVPTVPLDPSQPWRAGVLPVVEVDAAGLPEWTDDCPYGAGLLIVAEFDPEGGSRGVRRRGPLTVSALTALLDSLPGTVVEAAVVPWSGRAPSVVLRVVGGESAEGADADVGAAIESAVVREIDRLVALCEEADETLGRRSGRDVAGEDIAVIRAMSGAACARGWSQYSLHAPSRSGLTMRALRRAPRRPVALRRVPGQVARGLLRRGRKDRLVVDPAPPAALANARAAAASGDVRDAAAALTFSVVALVHDESEVDDLEHQIDGLRRPPERVVVLHADEADGGWDLATALATVDTDLVAVWPAGVQVHDGVLLDLTVSMLESTSRFVAAPVTLTHLTELGLDLQRVQSLEVGYFAPLEDGIVLAAAADVGRFTPAGRDRPVIRLYDAARASGATTFVSPDVGVARHLGEMSEANAKAYHDAFGRLDEIVDEESSGDTGRLPVSDDELVQTLVRRRDELRDRCARLGAGSATDVRRVRAMLDPEVSVALALDWLTGEFTPSRDPFVLRAPGRLEAALAELFSESPRLRD